MSETIKLINGDIFKSNAELIIIPRSSQGSFSDSFLDGLLNMGITPPENEKSRLGDLYIGNTDNKNHKRVAYATTVDDHNSTYTSVRTISLLINRFVNQTNNIKSVAIPILGSGAGGLDHKEVYRIIKRVYNEHNAKYELNIYTTSSTIFEELDELPLYSDITSKKIVLNASINRYKTLAPIADIINSEEFYFSKALETFEEFLKFEGEDANFLGVLSDNYDINIPFSEFLNCYDKNSQEYYFLKLIGVLIAYIDYHAYNKNEWNQYDDKRTIARSNVRQQHWVKNLLYFRATNNNYSQISLSIVNALRFLQSPKHELSMLSDAHRKLLMTNLFPEAVSNGIHHIIQFMDSGRLLFKVKNENNKGHLITRILYLDEIKELWENDDSIYKIKYSKINDIENEEYDGEEEDNNGAIDEIDQTKTNQLDEFNTIVSKQKRRKAKTKGTIHSDQHCDEDLLEYNAYAHTIASFLKHPDTKPPLSIGILAPWGRGKTSLMRLLQKKLGSSKNTNTDSVSVETTYSILKKSLQNIIDITVVKKLDNPTIWFNAWKFQKSEQIWAGFAHEIIHQLVNQIPNQSEREKFWFRINYKRLDKKKLKNDIRKKIFVSILSSIQFIAITLVAILLSIVVHTIDILEAFDKPYIYALISLFPLISAVCRYRNKLKSKIDFEFEKYIKEPNYVEKMGYFHLIESDLKLVLEELVNQNNPAVIFIDDLDRCSPKMVAEVIEAINLFISGDFPGCYFVLGQDAQMVSAALDAAYKDFHPSLNNIHKDHGSLGWFFMEKFMQLQFHIPNINDTQAKDFLEKLLGQAYDDENKSDDHRIKDKCNQVIAELNERINLGGTQDDVNAIFVARMKELGQEMNKYYPDEIVELKEKMIDWAFKNFDEKNIEFINLIDEYAKYLNGSPRTIKKFVNLYRFYRFIQFSGQNQALTEIDSNILGRWILIMIRWPQLVRAIQWNTESTFFNGKDVIERIEYFENIIYNMSDFDSWKAEFTLDKKYPLWVTDKELFDFLRNTRTEKNSLKRAIEVGLW